MTPFREALGARGQGQGPRLQRALLSALPREGLVFGTIHPDNQPSLRTAARVGRRIVASLAWSRLERPA